MKNLKNTVAALALTATLGFGATVANAGILISDKADIDTTCAKSKDTFKEMIKGFIVAGFPQLNGMLISDGLIMSDKAGSGCKETNGILISDGFIVAG